MKESLYKRNCPTCNNLITYKKESGLITALKLNKDCRSCSAKIASKNYPERGWGQHNKKIEEGSRLNGFAGKTHSHESLNKMKTADKSYTKTDAFRAKMSITSSGINNPMFGKSVYSTWLEKYGKDIADHKMIELKQKQSINSSGERNGMYGKPSPNGSGNGWSGWYNGWFFRSLLELSYMINIIERFNLTWETAENSKYRVKYTGHDNQPRTYSADFIIDNAYMVEIKPKALQKSTNVKLKATAATIWCKGNNLKYKITSCTLLTITEIKELIETNKVELTKRYQIKYNEQYKNK